VIHDEFMKYEQMYERMDKNKDGKLMQAEFTDRG
jgi:hypothetical protein